MVVVRQHPDSKWWTWVCSTCTRWSTWAPDLHGTAIWHADRHARHDCPGQS
jgi:hypothetical protein